MKKRYAEEQIIKAIKKHEAGAKIENNKLKKLLAGKLLENEAMKDFLSKKW
ncbi:hypothetical protein NBRC116587_36030 [Pseudoteredinibacter isoporae]